VYCHLITYHSLGLTFIHFLLFVSELINFVITPKIYLVNSIFIYMMYFFVVFFSLPIVMNNTCIHMRTEGPNIFMYRREEIYKEPPGEIQ
jgi:hypothetical protein